MILKRDRAATHKKIKAVKQLVLINKFYDQCTNIYRGGQSHQTRLDSF